MQSIKIGVVEAQLKDLADQAPDGEGKAPVTPEQIRVAANLQAKADQIGKDQLLSLMDRLCIEYDTIRRTMRPGSERTRGMTKILVQARGLAPSVSDMMKTYQTSGAAGNRLAAIAMMQMEPQKADIDRLLDQFRYERLSFFCIRPLHCRMSWIRLQTRGRNKRSTQPTKAIQIFGSFAGTVDKDTMHVLQALVQETPN